MLDGRVLSVPDGQVPVFPATYVWSVRPDDVLIADARERLRVRSGVAETFLPGDSPVPAGKTPTSGELVLTATETWAGSRTVTVQRVNTARKPLRNLTWNNRPGVDPSATPVSVTQAGTVLQWRFDISADLAFEAAGGVLRGWRVTTTEAAGRFFHGPQARRTGQRPRVEASWVSLPPAPSKLVPSVGAVGVAKPVLGWAATVPFTAFRVLADVNDGTFVDPLFASGEVTGSVPTLDLATFTSPRFVTVTTTNLSKAITTATVVNAADVGATITGVNIPANATIVSVQSGNAVTLSVAATATGTINTTITRIFRGLANLDDWDWRVQVKNAAGWSPYSLPGRLARVDKPAVALTNPGATSGDGTPPFMWTVTPAVQTAYRAQLLDSAGRQLWTSGLVPGAALTATPTKGLVTDGATGDARVWVYDGVEREATPGDPDSAFAKRTFTLDLTGGATPGVTGLTATTVGGSAAVDLVWGRSEPPDYWHVTRDGATVAVLAGPASAPRTNLVTNPSFEVNTTGWAANNANAAIARDTAQFWIGAASLKVDTTAALSGCYTTIPGTQGSTVYTVSCYVRGTGSVRLDMSSAAGDFAVGSVVTLTSSWQRVTTTGTSLAASTNVLPVVRQMTAGAQTMWVDAVMLEQSGTVSDYSEGAAYAFRDWTAQPFVRHQYRVFAAVNGVKSSGVPVVSVTTRPRHVWLADPATNLAAPILTDEDGSWPRGITEEVHATVGGKFAVRVVSSLRGYEGVSFAGVVAGVPGLVDGEAAIGFVTDLAEAPSRVVRLIVGDVNIPVVTGITLNPDSRTREGDRVKGIQLTAWQQEEPGPVST